MGLECHRCSVVHGAKYLLFILFTAVTTVVDHLLFTAHKSKGRRR